MHLNLAIILILAISLIGIFVAVKRIDSITKEYQEMLELLEREE